MSFSLAGCWKWEKGEIGRSAPSHYAMMGYLLDTRALLEETAPAIVEALKGEGIDVVLLVPV